jgi:hypothetical protein
MNTSSTLSMSVLREILRMYEASPKDSPEDYKKALLSLERRLDFTLDSVSDEITWVEKTYFKEEK